MKLCCHRLIFISLVLILSSRLAAAGDEAQINELLKNGGMVTLENRVYEITGPIYIHSNTVLTGGPNTVIRVSSSSSQFFTGQIGIICNPEESLHNVEIYGFEIDGNIGNLPRSYDSTPGHDRDAEKLILIGGWSSDFGSNISVHNMVLHDSFSDAVYIRFTDGVYIYNNIISDAQHEGIFLAACRGGYISGNSIAGICSDCARLDNCQNFKVTDNIFFSFNGNSYGAYKNGNNGLQIGDSTNSVNHGFAPTKKPFNTLNIEVCNNTFADPGLRAIWYTGGDNVYIHDNRFIDANELETSGYSFGNYSYEHPPSLQTSKKVFSSIFDILKTNFSDTGRTEQTADSIPFSVQQTEQGRIAGGIKIIGFKDLINIDGVPYIPDDNSIIVKYAAVRAPSFNWWDIGVSNISQKVTTKIENRTAYAILTVTMEYYTITTNKLTGKTKKNTYTSTAVFNDSCPAPVILQKPVEAKAIITYFNNSITPHTLVYVPSQGLIKINYEYAENSSEHILMIGERTTGNNGIQITNFSTCEYWRGTIPYQGEALYISGSVDQSKLNITCFTPYESFKVTKFEYIEKAWKGESFSDWVLPFVLKLGIIIFFLWRLIRVFSY